MNFFDPYPRLPLSDADLKRRLGLDAAAPWAAEDAALAARTRAWFQRHAHPWWITRRVEVLAAGPDGLRTDELLLRGERLRARWPSAGGQTGVFAAVSAGPEVEEHAARLRRENHPREAGWLEACAAAALDALLGAAGARLCPVADREEQLVLAPLAAAECDRAGILRWLKRRKWPRTAYLDAAETGRLAPRFSRLALLRLAPRGTAAANGALCPCPSCPAADCPLRRAPHAPPAPEALDTEPAGPEPREDGADAGDLSARALETLARERLRIEPRGDDGSLLACFRFDGATCGGRGVPLAFDYTLVLGPRERGHPLLGALCRPAAESRGHEEMCGWQRNPSLRLRIDADAPPVLGQPLEDALAWRPHGQPTRCLCSESSRLHKWRLVLQTVHHRLRPAG